MRLAAMGWRGRISSRISIARCSWMNNRARPGSASSPSSQPNVALAVRALLEQRAALNAAGFLEGAAFAGAENLAPALRDIVARHAARLTGSRRRGGEIPTRLDTTELSSDRTG